MPVKLSFVEGLFNRVYSSRWNPLYQSGALALFLFLVVAISGVYLLLFYSVNAPYESVHNLSAQAYTGRWVRTLHRYASDAAVVAIIFHALKMLATGRSWGKRLRAWVSGWLLVAGILVCGVSGFVLVWDRQAQWILIELARLLDIIPVFTAPLPRVFSSANLGASFFFSILFLHVAIPLGLLALYLVHISRVARPTHQPPQPIKQFAVLSIISVAVLWPLGVQPEADFSRIVGPVRLDLFYTAWLPLTSRLPAWGVWLLGAGLALTALVGVPYLTRPKTAPPPSWVDWDSCTGCTTCVQDCPYEAITMVKRTGETALNPRRSEYVALVDPDLCISCGICAGSCAPMGVGPPERTGKAQMEQVKQWFEQESPVGDMVVIACGKSFANLQADHLYPVSCIGSLHTSVIEWMIRKGAAGVFLLSCPERDCHNREGPKWSRERLYHDREAELQARVDRRRIQTCAFAADEVAQVRKQMSLFQSRLDDLSRNQPESSPVLDVECEEKTPE